MLTTLFFHPSHSSSADLFVEVEMAVCHSVYYFAHTVQRANTLCQESLFWLKISGLGSAVNTRPSLKTSLITVMLQVFIFVADDVFLDLVLQPWLLLSLQQLVDGVGAEVGQLQTLDLDPDGSRVGQAAPRGRLFQAG